MPQATQLTVSPAHAEPLPCTCSPHAEVDLKPVVDLLQQLLAGNCLVDMQEQGSPQRR